MALKIIFAGTPEFAVPTLEALLNSEHQVCAVYSQPDRPAGRGQKLTASPVKQVALQHHIPVYQPITLRDASVQQQLCELQADVMIVVAYGLILPKAVLKIPRFGCVNVHASLLPRWRGAAPIQRAILTGDKTTGITIMQMDVGLDTGAILQQVSCDIGDDDTSETLHQRLAVMGAQALLQTLEKLTGGKLQPQTQDDTKACYAEKIEKQEAELDWQSSAMNLDHKIRAFNPWPVAFVKLNSENLRIWKAKSLAEKTMASPGTVISVDKTGIDIATGEGVLRVLELQMPGGKKLSANEFLNSRKDLFKVGAII